MSEPKFNIYLDDVICVAKEVPMDFLSVFTTALVEKYWEECKCGDLTIRIEAVEVMKNED